MQEIHHAFKWSTRIGFFVRFLNLQRINSSSAWTSIDEFSMSSYSYSMAELWKDFNFVSRTLMKNQISWHPKLLIKNKSSKALVKQCSLIELYTPLRNENQGKTCSTMRINNLHLSNYNSSTKKKSSHLEVKCVHRQQQKKHNFNFQENEVYDYGLKCINRIGCVIDITKTQKK